MKQFNLVVKNFNIMSETDENKLYIKGFANRYVNEEGLVIDRSKESVIPTGIDITNYMKNPVILFSHNPEDIVGRAVSINITPEGLEIEAEIDKRLNEKVFYAVKEGYLRAFSIGFKALDYKYDEENDIWYWTKIELFEISIVSVPDNQDSLFTVLDTAPCQNGGICLMSFDKNKMKTKNLKKEGDKMQTKAIKNNVISDRPWSEVDKTKLAEMLYEKGDKAYIDEAYLVVGDYEKRSTWKFPHHEFDGTDLIVNKNGVIAAWAALQGARANPNISPAEKLKAAKHLYKHYSEMLKQGYISEIPQELQDMVKELEAEVEKMFEDLEVKAVERDDEGNVVLTRENLVRQLSKESGISRKDLLNILLFLNFSLVKKDGSKTKFATKYKFKKETMYQDLVNWAKETKKEYKNDHEIEAFSKRFRDMALSTISRASAWIYTTYLIRQDIDDDQERLLMARTFAESWFFRMLGLTFENLKKFETIVKRVDKYSDVVQEVVNAEDYNDAGKDSKETDSYEQKEFPPVASANQEFNIEEMKKTFEEKAKSKEGLSELFDLYTQLEGVINTHIKNFI
jgi:HK97 family phage prohead protease